MHMRRSHNSGKMCFPSKVSSAWGDNKVLRREFPVAQSICLVYLSLARSRQIKFYSPFKWAAWSAQSQPNGRSLRARRVGQENRSSCVCCRLNGLKECGTQVPAQQHSRSLCIFSVFWPPQLAAQQKRDKWFKALRVSLLWTRLTLVYWLGRPPNLMVIQPSSSALGCDSN